MKHICIIILLTTASTIVSAVETISMDGSWRFELDRVSNGVIEQWWERMLPGAIALPGSLTEQGVGDPIGPDTPWTGFGLGNNPLFKGEPYTRYKNAGDIKIPWALQPDCYYQGAAWFQRDIEIPESWRGKRVEAYFERIHWESRLWIDGREVGTRDSLSVPHAFDLGMDLTPGRHTISLRVDNKMVVEVGPWAHSVTDHTQGNWNGVIGRMELRASSPVWLDDVQVWPDAAKRTVRVTAGIGNATGESGSGILSISGQSTPVTWTREGGLGELVIPLDANAPLWDEFTPSLHQLEVRLDGPGADDRRLVAFGLRDLSITPERLFAVNGRPVFLRGTLNCCEFPLTGYPPMDIEAWKRIIGICKSYGLNHMRFHSWCPPEAAFQAADEMGFYFQIEAAAWATVGDGKPVDAWVHAESKRILKEYGNHPSFIMMAYGNEPSGANMEAYLTDWVTRVKAEDPRRLYTSAAAWPELPVNDYHVSPRSRCMTGWPLGDYRAAYEKCTVPVVIHEQGQPCAYPPISTVSKYNGVMKARNYELFAESLASHGMAGQAEDFTRASGRLQTMFYKEQIELALKTPGVGGFQLLGLQDFPGQGTAPVGVLDAFWDSKGYTTPEEWRAFCSATVPLARLKRVWTADETLTADVEIAHFGPMPINEAVTFWRIVDASGATHAEGVFPAMMIPTGHNIPLGVINASLAGLPAPARYRLMIEIKDVEAANAWDIWIYPSDVTVPEPPSGVAMTSSLDEKALAALDQGTVVLLALNNPPRRHPRIQLAPIFWNRVLFQAQSPILGFICSTEHPAFAAFPTDEYPGFQWQGILGGARAVVMDDLPGGLKPIAQPIDDWNSNRRLGLLFECKVGKGRLLVCSSDLPAKAPHDAAARQLLRSILDYAASSAFDPKQEVSHEALVELFTDVWNTTLARIGAKVIRVDSQAPGFEAAKALDDDMDTFWHTAFNPDAPLPHEIVIDMGQSMTIKGVKILQRNDGNPNGWIRDCEVYLSDSPDTFGEPRASATLAGQPAWCEISFMTPVSGRYIRIVSLSEANGQQYTGAAEIDIMQ